MAARLAPLLRVKGLLRKQFDIDLPPDPDPAAVRDGIAPPPRTGEPDRLGRLDTIIRGAPLDVWTAVAGRNPAATLAMLDGEPRVVDAIFTAAALRSDAEWARALLELRADARLLGCLPAAEQEPALLRHIRGGTLQPMALAALLRDMPRPWGLAVGRRRRSSCSPPRTAAIWRNGGRVPAPGAAARRGRPVPPPAATFRRRRQPAPGVPGCCAVPIVPTIPDGGLPMTDAQTTAPDILRAHAETAYADELLALAAADDRPRPPSWRLSPWAVATYILGGTLADGTEVSPNIWVRRGWWKSPWRHLPPTGACCCSGCRARRRPGSASTWPRPFPARPPWWCRAPPAHRKRRSGMAGTTRGCSPMARPGRPWWPDR